MKKIYTSNYARKGSDPLALAISVGLPEWYAGKRNIDLAPTWEIVRGIQRGQIDIAVYESVYLQLLENRNVDPYQLIETLPNNTFLLCYEKPTDFCHRHTLANWVLNNTGFQIEEWKNEKEQKEADKQGIVDSLLEL